MLQVLALEVDVCTGQLAKCSRVFEICSANLAANSLFCLDDSFYTNRLLILELP